MKNNKVLIIIGIILLNVLVVYMSVQSLLGKPGKYDIALQEAREFAKQELCARSIEKYNEALDIEDSLSIRLEMLDVYEKGMDIGELTNTYSIFTTVNDMVNDYRKESSAYEGACELFIKYGKYEECADILMQARDLEITSDKIKEYTEEIRFQFSKYFSMYTDVLPLFDGIHTVITDGTYEFLDSDASAEVDGEYLYASSFSEGYSFVKVPYTDGTEKSVLINKSAERQVYLDSVETSSGVGKAKNSDGDSVYLLACKVGDRYKYYNTDGKEVFGDYEYAGRFRNNVAAVKLSEGKWQLINGSGKPITDTVFTDVALNEFEECAAKGYIFAAKDGVYNLYDLDMKQIGDFSCDDAKPFVDNYAAFKSGELWGFVDAEGKVIIEPQYEDAKSFSCGMAGVSIGGVWSFINSKNEVVIEGPFEDVDYLTENGICFVKEGGYWSYLKMYYTGK